MSHTSSHSTDHSIEHQKLLDSRTHTVEHELPRLQKKNLQAVSLEVLLDKNHPTLLKSPAKKQL